MEYTKEKWEQHGNSIQAFQRGCICIAPKPQDGGVIERMDNLAIIAAAPELYEACKLALKLAEAVVAQISEDNVEVLMARATISEALAKVEDKR